MKQSRNQSNSLLLESYPESLNIRFEELSWKCTFASKNGFFSIKHMSLEITSLCALSSIGLISLGERSG